MDDAIARKHAPSAPRALTPRSADPQPGYHDLSFLKAPVWKWEIASYFFFEGLSSGSYVLARLAERFGGEQQRALADAATDIAALALVPCPPLLIHDLGDAKRFHHMLRIWKPTSPMNLGSWTLSAYGAMVAVAAARRRGIVADRVAVPDVIGIPLAILFSGYTGVLLSCTANPLWCKNRWLAPLFAAAAFSAAAHASALALPDDPHDPAPRAGGAGGAGRSVLRKIGTLAAAAETLCVAGYLKSAGPAAKPLTRGRYRKHLAAALAGIVAAQVLDHAASPGRRGRWTRRTASLLGLASGFTLKWALIHAGQDAARDPRLAHAHPRASSPSKQRENLPRRTHRS